LQEAAAVNLVVVVIVSNKFGQSVLPAFTSADSRAKEKFPGIMRGRKSHPVVRKTIAITAFGLWALATALNQPPPTTGSGPLLAGAQADSRTLAILSRSCQNCHSVNTKWPLYGRAWPVSTLLQHDVQKARSHMNLSQWPMYDNSEKRRILSEMGEVVRKGAMPPRRYTFLHPDAHLSQEEANHIYEWTRSSRRFLKTAEAQEDSLASQE
jgi:hypothetical protein